MSKVLEEVLAANAAYVSGFDKGDLPMPPGRHFAILTCMDARLDPAKYAGLAEGDAHVIRNAGGRASDDAIRSLVISYKSSRTMSLNQESASTEVCGTSNDMLCGSYRTQSARRHHHRQNNNPSLPQLVILS